LNFNKPHLLGNHYPGACSVPTLAEQAPHFLETLSFLNQNFPVNQCTWKIQESGSTGNSFGKIPREKKYKGHKSISIW